MEVLGFHFAIIAYGKYPCFPNRIKKQKIPYKSNKFCNGTMVMLLKEEYQY